MLSGSCVTKFMPEISENIAMIVVDGLITDQAQPDTIKLYNSIPLGDKDRIIPVKGCTVLIEDDHGNVYYLNEIPGGKYITDPAEFQGMVGLKYTLKIFTNSTSDYNYSYQSYPMEMKPVPPINDLFYEKTLIEEESVGVSGKEGCHIYLNTYDASNNCRFFKWDYKETWQIHLPFDIINKTCWVSNKSDIISVKNTTLLSENRIEKHPLLAISNETDRLAIKYSILVNQYSINEDEFIYWNKIKDATENVGSLYDVTPSSIRGNMFCVEDPDQVVLGYFSVSAKSSKRLFIKDNFSGLVNKLPDCIDSETTSSVPPPYLNKLIWIIISCGRCIPPLFAYTYDQACADCTMRGTNIEPDFWVDNK